MTTNVIRFRRQYLVKFLKYHLERKDRIERFVRTWAMLHASNPPKNYIPKPTSRLASDELVIRLSSDKKYNGKFWLSFDLQRELENIVLDIFDAVVFRDLLSYMWEQRIDETIERLAERYDFDIETQETIRKRFYRLRAELYEKRHYTRKGRNSKKRRKIQ